jgi:hypothetical protein
LSALLILDILSPPVVRPAHPTHRPCLRRIGIIERNMKTTRRTGAIGASGTGKSPGPATLRDIATIAGVSMQTVSLVINNSGSISQAVRNRIQEVARSVGYIPNNSAKAMRTGRSQTLGLIINDLGHPYWAEYAQEAERAAAAQQ